MARLILGDGKLPDLAILLRDILIFPRKLDEAELAEAKAAIDRRARQKSLKQGKG